MTVSADQFPLRVLPARRGRAIELSAGQELEVINQAGSQVVDTWAIDPVTGSYLSVEHTRAINGRLIPRVGDHLFSSLRHPLLSFSRDTSPGVHDMLIPSCDAERYRQLGFEGLHDNCSDNFRATSADIGLKVDFIPNPLNLFMNVPWTADGDITFAAPMSRPGDSIRLRAEVDVVVVLSACPQDLLPVNGDLLEPQDVHYRVLTASA